MRLDIGFDRVIGLSDLPTLPLGDSYHVCLYNPATGLEYEAEVTTTNLPEGLGGDVFYIWPSTLTATMTEGTYDLKIYDVGIGDAGLNRVSVYLNLHSSQSLRTAKRLGIYDLTKHTFVD